jgi:Fe-S cluster assembly protein SufD
MASQTVMHRKPRVITRGGSEFPFSEADVKRASENLGEPAWLAERRLQAWKRYRSLPLPSLKDETWRRTDIRGLPASQLNIKPADDLAIDPRYLEPLTSHTHGSLLILHPGRGTRVELHEELIEKGVIFTDWRTAVQEHSDLLERHLGAIAHDGEDKFSALTEAMVEDGIFIYVPVGVTVEQPLHSVFWVPGERAAFFSRVLLIVEDDASLTYVHESLSPSVPEADAVHTGMLDIYVGSDSKLNFVELQNLGKHVWNFSHEWARVGRGGRLDWVFGGIGSRLTKSFSELDLLAEGAEGRISGFYFADENQHLDHDTQQNHIAPHTTSDLLFKGALVERSRSVWRGMIYVAPGAQHSDGYQANRNLILSDRARADSIPGLEILADDVRCTHGATVGQLEEEPIFYLMSRGIPRPEAERLVIDGFFAEIMDRVPFEGVRDRFRAIIEEKLGNR